MRKGSGFEDTAAPAELHNFNSPPVLDVTHSFSELIEAPDEEDKKLWAENPHLSPERSRVRKDAAEAEVAKKRAEIKAQPDTTDDFYPERGGQ